MFLEWWYRMQLLFGFINFDATSNKILYNASIVNEVSIGPCND